MNILKEMYISFVIIIKKRQCVTKINLKLTIVGNLKVVYL